MDSLLSSLTQPDAKFLLALNIANLGAILLVAFMALRTSIRQARYQARWRELLQGSTGESIENILLSHVREKNRLEQLAEELNARVSALESGNLSAKRHLGLVRYDAFTDVGGNQSFALAIYDDHGNGAVINSIIGRTECRVYCKPLVSGRSERDLSQEEQRAIREAKASGPRSILSPE